MRFPFIRVFLLFLIKMCICVFRVQERAQKTRNTTCMFIFKSNVFVVSIFCSFYVFYLLYRFCKLYLIEYDVRNRLHTMCKFIDTIPTECVHIKIIWMTKNSKRQCTTYIWTIHTKINNKDIYNVTLGVVMYFGHIMLQLKIRMDPLNKYLDIYNKRLFVNDNDHYYKKQ